MSNALKHRRGIVPRPRICKTAPPPPIPPDQNPSYSLSLWSHPNPSTADPVHILAVADSENHAQGVPVEIRPAPLAWGTITWRRTTIPNGGATHAIATINNIDHGVHQFTASAHWPPVRLLYPDVNASCEVAADRPDLTFYDMHIDRRYPHSPNIHALWIRSYTLDPSLPSHTRVRWRLDPSGRSGTTNLGTGSPLWLRIVTHDCDPPVDQLWSCWFDFYEPGQPPALTEFQQIHFTPPRNDPFVHAVQTVTTYEGAEYPALNILAQQGQSPAGSLAQIGVDVWHGTYIPSQFSREPDPPYLITGRWYSLTPGTWDYNLTAVFPDGLSRQYAGEINIPAA